MVYVGRPIVIAVTSRNCLRQTFCSSFRDLITEVKRKERATKKNIEVDTESPFIFTEYFLVFLTVSSLRSLLVDAERMLQKHLSPAKLFPAFQICCARAEHGPNCTNHSSSVITWDKVSRGHQVLGALLCLSPCTFWTQF